MNTFEKIRIYGLRASIAIVVTRIKQELNTNLLAIINKFGLYNIKQFTTPYIIEKSLSGLHFLLSIEDQDSKLYYDLAGRDSAWPELRYISEYLLKTGDSFVEVGSHHGCSTIFLAKVVGSEGRGFAFEPGHRNCEALRKNIRLNGLLNVECYEYAVGAYTGNVKFIASSDFSMSNHVASTTNGRALEVKQVSLDDFLGVVPNLIKIDVQGYVEQVIDGMLRTLHLTRVNFAIEIDPPNVIKACGGDIVSLLEKIDLKGYQYFAQFKENESPSEVTISSLLERWHSANAFRNDIHLYMKVEH